MRKGLTRRQVLFGLVASCFGLTALRPAARAAIAGPPAGTAVLDTAAHTSAARTTFSYDRDPPRLCQMTSPYDSD